MDCDRFSSSVTALRRFPRFRKNERAAFTLIELLVVIGIIAIVAAIAFPVFGGAKERANVAKCTGNLRQIGIAMQSFAAEHNNQIPQRVYQGDDKLGYDEFLLPYTGQSTKIFTCPSQKTVNYPHEPGYGMNWYYDNQSLLKAEHPSQTILLTETAGDGGYGSHRADRDQKSPGQLDDKRHKEKSNYAFFDGHVAMLKYSETRIQIDTDAETNTPIDMWGKDWSEHDNTPP